MAALQKLPTSNLPDAVLDRRQAVPALIDRPQDFLIVTGLAGAAQELSAMTGNSPNLFAMGGAMGAAPTLIWLGGALAVVLFPLLAGLALWLYVLVFVFTGLWFQHYCLEALSRHRSERAADIVATVKAPIRDIN